MISCGRIRKEIQPGSTTLVDTELAHLKMDVLNLAAGQSCTLHTGEREYALVLVHGECAINLSGGLDAGLGPRKNPFEDMASGLFVSKEETITVSAKQPSMIGIGSAPASVKTANTLIDPNQVVKSIRGSGNWTREVRKIFWSDNSEGNMLLAGETCTFSGNWSTMPPHRHQFDIPGQEAPYEEVYFFQFSRPQGFGLIWQFDDDMDQAFSLKTNDAVYVGRGYHPVVCGPGSTLYHLTFMAGPRRESQANVHPDYQFLLDEQGLQNQFVPD